MNDTCNIDADQAASHSENSSPDGGRCDMSITFKCID